MAEPQKESWLKLVALTIMFLALASAFADFKSQSYYLQGQISAAREARLWQDYQVESLKKDSYALHRDLLVSLKPQEAKSARGPKTLGAKLKEYDDEITRLNQEKDQVKKEARNLAAQAEGLEKRAGDLGLAMVLFQAAILSSAAAVIVRKKILWLVGLGLGVWGLVYLAMGLLP